jgi:hypothetical protein
MRTLKDYEMYSRTLMKESRFYHIWPDVNGAGFYGVQVAFIWAMLQKN